MLILYNENILKLIFINNPSGNTKKTLDDTKNTIICKTLLKIMDFDKIFRSLKFYSTLINQSSQIDCLGLLPSGELITASNDDNTIRILNSNAILHTKKITDEESIGSLYLLSDGNIAANNKNGIIKIWDPKDFKRIKTIPFPKNNRLDGLFIVSNNDIACACTETTKTSDTAMTISFCVSIMSFKEDYKIIKQLEAQWDCFTPMANLSNSRLAVGCLGGTIIIYDVLNNYDYLKALTESPDIILSLLYLEKDNLLLSGYYDGTIIVWDASDLHRIRSIDARKTGVKELLFLRRGYFSSCPLKGMIKIWDLNGFECINVLQSTRVQTSLVFMKDYRIASILDSRKIGIWNY
jgi:WD40 repeat protein